MDEEGKCPLPPGEFLIAFVLVYSLLLSFWEMETFGDCRRLSKVLESFLEDGRFLVTHEKVTKAFLGLAGTDRWRHRIFKECLTGEALGDFARLTYLK